MNMHVSTPVRSFTGASCAWFLPDSICEQIEDDMRSAAQELREPYSHDRAVDTMLRLVFSEARPVPARRPRATRFPFA